MEGKRRFKILFVNHTLETNIINMLFLSRFRCVIGVILILFSKYNIVKQERGNGLVPCENEQNDIMVCFSGYLPTLDNLV